MKIKSVCEQTGLTSRTVRLYIEEELISPKFSENYLGRRSYDFSDGDVEELKDIATLRSFGFSIAEIKRIIESSENSTEIIADLCKRKDRLITEEQQMIGVLSALDCGKCYSIREIANALNSAPEKRDLPDDDTMSKLMYYMKNPKKIARAALRVFDYLLLAVSMAFQLYYPCGLLFEWKFPRVNDWKMFFIVYSILLLPVFIILSVLIITKLKSKRVMKGIGVLAFAVVIVLFVPTMVSGLFTPFESYTDSFCNYRVSENELIEAHPFLNELFPKLRTSETDILENDPNAVYHYRRRATLDYTTEIMAEWKLDNEKFTEEVERIGRLFDAFEYYEGDDAYYTYTTVERGGYKCLIRYYGNGTVPFEVGETDYAYYIFAYNEETKKVRYIYNYSGENGFIKPFIIDLDW